MITSLLPLAFVALGLGAVLFLFVGVKHELYKQSLKYRVSIDQIVGR